MTKRGKKSSIRMDMASAGVGGVVEPADAADMAAIEAALGELEIEDNAGSETITEITESDEAALEALTMRDDAIDGVEVSTTGVSEEAPAAEPVTEKKARTPKDSSAPKKERAPRDLNSLDDAVFALVEGEAADKAHVLSLVPKQKKVIEKFENLFQAIAAGKQPSVYTMSCFNVVADKGTCTQSDLVAALMSTSLKKGGKTYNEGTARSQAGQMMALFGIVGIASREKNTLTFNPKSAIAAKLKALPTA